MYSPAVAALLEAAREMDLPEPDPDDPFAPADYNREVRQFARAGYLHGLEVRAEQFGFAATPIAAPTATPAVYDAEEGARFLARLFEGVTSGFMDFRTVGPDGERKRLFVRVDEVGAEAEWVTRYNARGWPVWVGVAPRASTRNGRAENCQPPRWLYADIDFKGYAGGEDEARRRLAQYKRVPSMLVETGGGLHAYWSVSPPTGEGWTTAMQARLRQLADDLGADPKAIDVARVLRLPGTHNAKYDPPRPVRLVSLALL